MSLTWLGITFFIAACNNNSGVPQTPTLTPPLTTPRPTLTPRPTISNNVNSVIVNALRESEPTVAPTIYTVQDGDTLIPIANKFGVSLADLVAANPGLDPARIRVGQRLVIPTSSGARAVTNAGQLLPSPTPLPYTIRGSHIHRTAAGSLECLGEVFNPGPTAITNVQLQINLIDESNKTLTSSIFFVARDFINSGASAPFRVQFTDPPANFSRFTIQAMRGEPVDTTSRFAKLDVSRKEGALVDNNQFNVRGEIINKDSSNAKNTRIIITTYDDQKRVIGFRNVILGDGNLPANSSVPFDVNLVTVSKVSDFQVSVEGLK